MTMKTLLYIGLIATAGCAVPHHVIYIQDHPADNPAPWSEGHTSTYWVGRTVMDRDGSVMHEAHPVYRREDAGRPQLAVRSEAWLPAGSTAIPTNSIIEQADLLQAQTARARELTRQVMQASEELLQHGKAFNTTGRTDNLLQIQHLLQVTHALSNRISRVEGQISKPGNSPEPKLP